MRLALLVLCISATVVEAANPTDTLIARLTGPTAVLDDLRDLVDGIGGRPTGSPALDRAIDWSLARFKDAGVDRVVAEDYVAPRTWLPRVETVEVTAPGTTVLRAAAMPFSRAVAGVEAEVVDVGAPDSGQIGKLGGSLKGKWLLVHSAPLRSLEDLFKEYLETPVVFAAASKVGAAGVLWMSGRPSRQLYRHNITLDGTLGAVPGILIEHEGGMRIADLLAAGTHVKVKVTIATDVVENAKARNVVAEIKGREKPDEVVVIGAHLDSWDLGRGALDDGCNVALVIDIARQLAALATDGQRPRRTIRFVLYTGEELGLYGSWLDAHNHRADLDKIDAMIEYDIGTGRTLGFSLGGRSDLEAGVTRALAPVAGLGPFTHTADAFVGTDNYDYLLEGVPNLVANQDGAPYLADYHAESDTLDKVDARELKLNSVIAGVLVWGLAEDPKRLGARQSRREIEALVKATGLDVQMRTFGLWNDFAAGRRGRAR
ncbi:MAG: M28 family peptidase [Deltaproteobacteria bacterium]|nr:M28 family peptidase [Deltaproteobacteria bacterium]